MSPAIPGISSPSGEDQGLPNTSDDQSLANQDQISQTDLTSTSDDEETGQTSEVVTDEDETDEETSDEGASNNKANIMFVGKEEVTTIVEGKSQTEMKPRTPPTHIQNGMVKINLPKRDKQLDGPFYHEKADEIIQLFPTLYKHYK